jgi:TolA-binding protein
MNLRLLCAVLGALAMFGAGPAAAGKSEATGTLSDLATREIEIESDALRDVAPEQAIGAYRRFLALDGIEPGLRAEALRRLADLLLERDEEARSSDATPHATAALREAIDLYSQLLAASPDFERRDTVMYQLARAHEAALEPAAALEVLGRLVARYPDSAWFAEAQFRRGEILFVESRYAAATPAYAAVIAAGADSGYFDQALYKHGWSLFKQSRGEEGAESFFTLLDRKLGADDRLVDAGQLSRAEHELVDDSLRVVAITMADLEGSATLDELLDRRGDPVYVHLLYAALGDLYLEKERYQDAADAYSAFSVRRPDAEQAPLLQVRAIEAYRQGGFESRVLESKQAFVERYALGTSYWATRTFAEAPEVARHLENNLRDLAQYHHARAQAAGERVDFDAAARWYRALLDTFPERESAAETRYLLADVLFEGGRFADAAIEYERTAYEYPAHARSAEAGYAALVAYEKHEAALAGEERSVWHAQMTDSKVRFATAFPAHPQAATVLTSALEDLWAANDYDATIAVSRQLLALDPPVGRDGRRIASTLLAHALFETGRFAEAETAYVALQPQIPPGDPLQSEVVERIAASIYRQAEQKRDAGDGRGAVEDFLRIAILAPTSQIRANAEFDAAQALLQLGDTDRAIGVMEDFRATNPEHPLAADATRTLASAYLETGQGTKAATEFEQIASSPQESVEVRRSAAWQAAELFAEAAQPASAARVYARYVQDFPRPLDEAMEARLRLVDLSTVMHDSGARDLWNRELVRADREAGSDRTERSRYLGAKAALALTERAVSDYAAIRLVAPLDQSLGAKRAAMERALELYGKALDYGVAEVTTAATYGMAELYRTLAEDLLASERPAGLDAEALDQYDLLLEEQVYPFEEKAIELHEVNAQRTHEGVYDAWIERSFAALALLVPARYAKAEVGEAYVATLN